MTYGRRMRRLRRSGAEWLARFDQQRRELNPQKAERITPELGQVVAQRVASALLAADEKLRTDPEVARRLLLTVRAAVPSRLTIGPRPLPAWAADPMDPFEWLPEDLASELAALNEAMDGQAAQQMAFQRVTAVLPMAQAEATKLGVTFDTKTLGALEMPRECLKAYGATTFRV